MPQEQVWYRLDNAGVLYSALKKEKYAPVYRFSAVMDEPVDPDALQRAVDRTMPRFPTFRVRIRKGFFWCYFEPNPKPGPFVKPDISNPCQPMRDRQDNDWLIRFYYYESRISFEAFHAIADGSGALAFFRTLLAEYLRERGVTIPPDPLILDVTQPPAPEELEDAYGRYAGPRALPGGRKRTAYPNTSTPEPFYTLNVTMGLLSVAALKQKARGYGATITEYLTAVLLLSLIEKQRAEQPFRQKPVALAIPVNLRGWFPSRSLRNFMLTLRPLRRPHPRGLHPRRSDPVRPPLYGPLARAARAAGRLYRQRPVHPEPAAADHPDGAEKADHGLFLLAAGGAALHRHLHQSGGGGPAARHGRPHPADGGHSGAGHPALAPLRRHQLRRRDGGDLRGHRQVQRDRAALLHPSGPGGAGGEGALQPKGGTLMSYCVNCGVELDDTVAICPLCHTPVQNPNRPVDRDSPTPFPAEPGLVPLQARRAAAALVSAMLGAAALSCGLLNLILPARHIWSLYVIGAAAMLWVFLVPPLLWRALPRPVMVLLDTGAAALYLLAIAWELDGLDWYLRLALPAVALLGAIVLALVLLLAGGRRSILSSTSLLIGAAAVYLAGLELLGDRYFYGQWQPGWSLVILIVAGALEIPLIVVRRVPSLRQEARRRFHL